MIIKTFEDRDLEVPFTEQCIGYGVISFELTKEDAKNMYFYAVNAPSIFKTAIKNLQELEKIATDNAARRVRLRTVPELKIDDVKPMSSDGFTHDCID